MPTFRRGDAAACLRSLGFEYDYPTPYFAAVWNDIQHFQIQQAMAMARSEARFDKSIAMISDLRFRAAEIAESFVS